jgi:hypothetical protein
MNSKIVASGCLQWCPGNVQGTKEKGETTDYTDYADFFIFLCVPSCNFVAIFMVVHHDAAGLTRRRMKIMLSIFQFYCRGLIYQALANGRFIPGFDESNPYSPYSPHSTYSPIFIAHEKGQHELHCPQSQVGKILLRYYSPFGVLDEGDNFADLFGRFKS